jgi:Fur family ferric uptake transcriptional regulator
METSAGQEQVRELFERYLEEQGHRKTPERFAILAEVYAFEGHFDMEALYVHMKGRNYRVSRATLYNTMELLIDCGLVRRHQFGDKTAQFEKCYRIRQHDHVILADTGEVLEFCDPRIQQITSTLEELFGIEVLHHSLHVFARRKTAENGKSTAGRPTLHP